MVYGEQSCLKMLTYKYDQETDKFYGLFSLNNIKIGQHIKLEVFLTLDALLPTVITKNFKKYSSD